MQNNNALSSLTAPLCSQVHGYLVVSNTVITQALFPSLTFVGQLLVVNYHPIMTTISFAALTGVGATFQILHNPVLSTLVAPLLTVVGSHFYISSNGFQNASISFPALASVGGELLLDMNNESMVSFPLLTAVSINFQISSDALVTAVLLPQLHSVGGYLQIDSCIALTKLSLDALQQVNGSIVLAFNAITMASFPVLHSVSGDVELLRGSLLSIASFPLLQSVGGNLDLSDNPGIVSFWLPNLQIVDGMVQLHDNSVVSSISFPLLTTIQGRLSVNNNVNLRNLFMPFISLIGEYIQICNNDPSLVIPLAILQVCHRLVVFLHHCYCYHHLKLLPFTLLLRLAPASSRRRVHIVAASRPIPYTAPAHRPPSHRVPPIMHPLQCRCRLLRLP